MTRRRALPLTPGFYEPPFVGGERSHLLLIQQEDGGIDAVDPRLASRLLAGRSPLTGAARGQEWARLMLVELHLTDHKGYPQAYEELAAIAGDAALFVRVPLAGDGCFDVAALQAGVAGRGVCARAMGWRPAPGEAGRLVAGAAEILGTLSQTFFVRSGRRDAGCVALDS